MSQHPWFGWLAFVSAIATAAAWTEPAFAQPRRVKTKGEVVTVVGNTITMLDAGKNLLTVKPKAESPLIEISGPWKLDEINSQLVIRLTGTLKANALTEEIAELTIHSPADGYQLGIQQDAADRPATILGQFVRIKDQQLTIAVGKRRVTAKLSEDAVAKVDSKDLRFIRKGDAIEIDAYTTSSGTLSGRSIKVRLKELKPPDEKQQVKSDKKGGG